MKTIGLLGGMTFEATTKYYNSINHHIRSQLGGRYSASILMNSYNFHPLLALMTSGQWDKVADTFVSAAVHMKAAGAQGLVICANYPHKVAHEVEARSGMQLLHIADFTAAAIKAAGASSVGLLGTKAVMEEPYVKGRVTEKVGIEVLVPEEQSVRDAINRELMATLPSGIVTPEIRGLLISAAEDLVKKGAQGIILGSTDLAFALKDEDINVPLFDTGVLHAVGIAEWALEESDYAEVVKSK